MRAASVDEIRRRFAFFDEYRRPIPPERLPGRQALLGEEPEPLVVRFRPVDGGAERWSRVKARPLMDEHGRVRMAINLIEDITEIKRAEEEQRFLAEAGRVLASSLDLEHTLQSVASLAVPQIADWCIVDLSAPHAFQRVAIAHADPAKLHWIEEVSRRYPPDPHAPRGAPQVLRTGRSELYREITDELLAASAQDEEHLELLRSAGMISAMVVPMLARGEPVGAITMVNAESGHRFNDDDLALAQELGRRAGTAVENARLYRQRSEIARTLQASLLPPELPEIPGMHAAAVFRAAGEGFDVGGDFYDLFSTAEDQWYTVIGDVCGKGAEAAATTAMVRYTIRAAAVRRRSPAAILHWLNDAMLRQSTGPLRFCTLAIARLDLGEEIVRMVAAGAGHPLPRIVRANGRVERVGVHGTLVGVTRDLAVEERASELHAGDAAIFFTDGLIEARAPLMVWSSDQVDAALGAAAAACGGSLERLLQHTVQAALGGTDAPLRDDLALLGLLAR